MITKKKAMTTPTASKEDKAVFSFNLTIRDVEHFNTIVKWLNHNVGPSKENWTTGGRIRTHLRSGKAHTTKVYIFNPDFDTASSLIVSLL